MDCVNSYSQTTMGAYLTTIQYSCIVYFSLTVFSQNIISQHCSSSSLPLQCGCIIYYDMGLEPLTWYSCSVF